MLHQPSSFSRSGARLSASRGFTLTELMIVVVIMSILATLGISAFRRKMNEAYKTEALAGLRAIGAAQESHRAESGVYLNVSATLSSYYPAAATGTKFQFWGQPGGAAWQRLDPEIPNLVSYSYATTAGLPYTQPGSPDSEVDGLTWPVANTIREPWYVVAARGDIDGDGSYSYFLSTNLSSQVHIQNAFE